MTLDDELRFEELLRVHASKAEERILANLPEPGERHVFSERFEREMRVAIGRAASGKKPRRLGAWADCGVRCGYSRLGDGFLGVCADGPGFDAADDHVVVPGPCELPF